MAKISARGDSALTRWTKGDSELVHTEHGRLLRRILKGDSHNLVATNVTPDQAKAWAERMGYQR